MGSMTHSCRSWCGSVRVTWSPTCEWSQTCSASFATVWDQELPSEHCEYRQHSQSVSTWCNVGTRYNMAICDLDNGFNVLCLKINTTNYLQCWALGSLELFSLHAVDMLNNHRFTIHVLEVKENPWQSPWSWSLHYDSWPQDEFPQLGLRLLYWPQHHIPVCAPGVWGNMRGILCRGVPDPRHTWHVVPSGWEVQSALGFPPLLRHNRRQAYCHQETPGAQLYNIIKG